MPDDVAARLLAALEARSWTLAVAESLTSGALASAVGGGEGASTWFGGGIVAYLPEVKERVLGFPADRDPTSAECAEQLARAARELFDADVCVSTTGVGGPDAEDGHPAGEVYIGWATRDEVGNRRLELDGALAPSGADRTLLDSFERLAPFGQGNPEPVFAFPGVRVRGAMPMRGGHLRCELVGEDGAKLRAVAWRCEGSALFQALSAGDGLLHLAGRLKADDWKDRGGVQLEIEDAADPRRNG